MTETGFRTHNTNMLQLPIPLFVALVLIFLGTHALINGRASLWLIAVVFVCAVQNVLGVLIHHYGWLSIKWVQPISAMAIPALIWLAFLRMTQRVLTKADYWHFCGIPVALVLLVIAPYVLDVLIPCLYAAYGVAIWRSTQSQHGDFPLARLSGNTVSHRVWLLLAVQLVISALSDISISLALAIGQGWLMPIIVSIVSSMILLLTGILILTEDLYTPVTSSDDASADNLKKTQSETADSPKSENVTPSEPPNQLSEEEEQALVKLLDEQLTTNEWFLDPDLTLQKLARKLGTPAKRLSRAINQQLGHNVSRHVNNFRIEYACRRLEDGAQITESMYECGFNTKSNFHREFTRVKGCTPSQWMIQSKPT